MDEILRNCKKCGEPQFVLRAGKEIQRRCKCDWERGFYERVLKTIEPEYWRKRVLTLKDWNPAIFKGPVAGPFRRLINFQKVMAMRKLHEFCFQQRETDEGVRFGIHTSIDKRRNLFVRGPVGSGKGLILASIKTLCAMKNISVTPLPNAFAVFKMRIINSEAFGREGEESKILVSGCYKNVDVLVIEDVKPERSINSANRRIDQRARGANSIDNLLAHREARYNSTILSSTNFAGEIGDTLGDKMAELLDSEKTFYLTMLSPLEADAILAGLRKRSDYFGDLLNDYREGKRTGRKERSMEEGMSEQQVLSSLREGFYFGEAFKYLPNPDGSVPQSSELQDVFRVIPNASPPKVKSLYREFLDEARARSLPYQEGLRMAQVNAMKACPAIGDRLGEREAEELGKMVSLATSLNQEEMKQAIIDARRLRDEMAGGEEGRLDGAHG